MGPELAGGPVAPLGAGLAVVPAVGVADAFEPEAPVGNELLVQAAMRRHASAPGSAARLRRGGIVGMYAGSVRAVPAVLGSPAVEAFEVYDILRELTTSDRLYHEFLRTHDLSVGLYRLPAGGTDPQSPHTEDEVYHVVRGRATITVGDEERPVSAGSIVFVGADVPHRFHDIEDELVVLVIFGPAEYTHRVDHQRGQPHGAAST